MIPTLSSEHHARRGRLGYGSQPMLTCCAAFPALEVRSVAVKRTVARRYGIALSEMTGPSRLLKFAWPRFVAVYLTRQITNRSFPRIGLYFGPRAHSTIISAWRRVARRIEADPAFAEEIAGLRREIERNLTINRVDD